MNGDLRHERDELGFVKRWMRNKQASFSDALEKRRRKDKKKTDYIEHLRRKQTRRSM